MSLRVNFSNILVCICFLCLHTRAFSDSSSVQTELDQYFARIDEKFSQLSKSSSMLNTKLSLGEKLLFRELKKNQAIYAFSRVNSKGKIVSLAVRSKSIERPDSSVENEKWFQEIQKNQEDYYTVTKDSERGRYYLIWAKPLLKKGKFTGAVIAKIDLWDSFYEFSNAVYYPFLIRLNGLSLFSHKWENSYTFKEEPLSIPGIRKVTVRYIPEKNAAVASNNDPSGSFNPARSMESDSLKAVSDSLKNTSISTVDSSKLSKVSNTKPGGKKGTNTILIGFSFVFLICLIILAVVIITKKRRAAFLKHLDEE